MKNKLNIVIAILVLACLVVLFFLVKDYIFVKKNPTITINGEVLVLQVGEEEKISTTVTDLDNYKISWSSSNPSVATVDDGNVKALSKGNTNITARIDEYDIEDFIVVIVNDIEIEKITFDNNYIEIYEDEEIILNYTITPINATNKDVSFEVSDENIIKIEDNVVKPINKGEARVTIKTSNGKLDTCTIVVKSREVPVEEIKFDKDAYDVYVNESINIIATIMPSDATNKEIIWESSDNTIATVTGGKVTGLKKGNVTITASTSSGNITKKVNVSVKKPEVKVNPKEVTIIGDSRMVGLCNYEWYKNEGGTCIRKGAMGYYWLRDTAIPEIDLLSQNKKKNIVTNLGVNDLDHTDLYIKKYKDMLNSTWKNSHLFILSVNPTEGTRFDRNDDIEEFNEKLKTSLANYKNVTYCDSYNYLKTNGFKTVDGIHYDEATSKVIYEQIKKCIYNYYNEL